MRGTSNANVRGNSRDRAARKTWLLRTYAANKALRLPVAPGETAPIATCRCYRCGVLLRFETLTVDRIVPGCMGGRYVRTNIRPACARCNSETGGQLRAA